MLGLAFVTCPCHLPILVAVLAGTSLGAYLRDNWVVAGIALTGVFVISLLLGLQWIGSGQKRPRK
jgi:mercuric ion transport protein